MVTSAPRIEQRGPVFRLHWSEEGVRVRVSRIHQSSRGEMHGEISVQYSSDLPIDGRYGWRHIVGSRYQITSDRSRGEIARRCVGRLVDDVEWLAETVQSKGIDLVVVDSAVPACGGNPNEPESVQGLFYGLRQLEVTSLIVAHVSKNTTAGPVTTPYGSVFWSNLSRNVWQAEKKQELGEDSMVVALRHRKTNVGPLLKPVSLKLSFSPSFKVERVSSDEYQTLVRRGGPLAERMAAALGDGAMSSSALAEAIGAKPNSVRTTLARKEERFVKLPGGMWGLRAD